MDYLISQNLTIVPIEIKSGVSGKMKSLRVFMNRKHLISGRRCSLENFGVLTFTDSSDNKYPDTEKQICIHPLYCMSTLV